MLGLILVFNLVGLCLLFFIVWRQSQAATGSALGTDFNDQNNRLFDRIQQALTANRREINDHLVKMTQLQKTDLEQTANRLTKQFKNLQDDNHQQLDRMRATVDEKLQSTLEKRFNESFKQVENRLRNVHQGLGEMQKLASEVGDLQRTLTNVSKRGAWGEIQLGGLLAEVLNSNQYDTNVQINPDSRERVEFAVKMPASDNKVMYLPIDAKFPLNPYQTLQVALDEGDKPKIKTARSKLATEIKKQAKTISQKYLKPPRTTNFAVLYLPTNGLFAEVISQVDLVETIHREHRVVIAGPTTILSVLSFVQMGYQALEISTRTSQVWQQMVAVREDFAGFGTLLDKASKKITEAGNSIETASRKSRTIKRQLASLQDPEIETNQIEVSAQSTKH